MENADWHQLNQQLEEQWHMEQQTKEETAVYRKLQQARIKLMDMQLVKTGHNPYAGFDYFDLGDFLPAVQRIFSELNLCGVVSFGMEMAVLRIVDLESGNSIRITSPMGSASLKAAHEVQNIGAVETYQRRYLWMAALEIVEQETLDASVGDQGDRPATNSQNHGEEDRLLAAAQKASKVDLPEYERFWSGLTPKQKNIIGSVRHMEFKKAAEKQSAQA